MLRKGQTHLTLGKGNVRRCPAEDPFCIFRRDVNTSMRAFLAKSIVPESAVNGNAFAANKCRPGNSRGGITSLSGAGGHVFGNYFPMSYQIPSRGGIFIRFFACDRVIIFPG